jgi:hypothetical protein
MVNPLFLLATNLMPYIPFDIYMGIRYKNQGISQQRSTVFFFPARRLRAGIGN